MSSSVSGVARAAARAAVTCSRVTSIIRPSLRACAMGSGPSSLSISMEAAIWTADLTRFSAALRAACSWLSLASAGACAKEQGGRAVMRKIGKMRYIFDFTVRDVTDLKIRSIEMNGGAKDFFANVPSFSFANLLMHPVLVKQGRYL